MGLSSTERASGYVQFILWTERRFTFKPTERPGRNQAPRITLIERMEAATWHRKEIGFLSSYYPFYPDYAPISAT